MTKKKKLHGRQKHQADPGEILGSNSSDEENNSQSNKCCPHVTKAVNLGAVKKGFKGKLQFGSCQNCSKKENISVKDEEEFCETIWMCLQCCHQGCGRLSRSKHALEHYETPHSDSHSIVVNTSLWSIWCYQCDDEVDLESSKRLSECVEFIKKQVDILSKNSNKLPSKPKPVLKETLNEAVNSETVENIKVTPEKGVKGESSLKINETKKINGLISDSNSAQVRGLVNLTNTCFFNAVLQNLSQIPCFLAALEEHCKAGKETEWRIKTPAELRNDIEDEYMTLPLPPSESMAVTLTNLLREMNSSPQQKKSPNINPKPLFSLIVQRFSQFRGGYQQDSHEFLRCLLDSVRTEEVKRQKRAVLKLFNLTEKTRPDQVEEDVKLKVKALGKNAMHTVIDKVFGGQLVSTVLCEQCQMTSQVFESFMDLSLPVCEEKPTRPGLHRKSFSEDGPDDRKGPSKYQEKKLKRQTKKEIKKQAKLTKKSAKVVPLSGSSESVFRSEGTGNEDEGSEADVNDADIEDNEDDNVSQEVSSSNFPTNDKNNKTENECHNTSESTSTNDSIVADSDQSTSLSRTLSSSSEVTIVGSDIDNNKEKDMDVLVQAVSELVIRGNKCESKDSLIESPDDGNAIGSPVVPLPKDTMYHLGSTDSGLGHAEKPEKENSAATAATTTTATTEDEWKSLKQEWKQKSWTSLAPRYAPTSHECSVLSCLNLFTHPELLMGKNKFGCDNCTKIKAEQSGLEKDKQPMVYTNATKQLHVFNPPAVLTLHLKRFHQSGMSLTKVNQFVDFPLILDLAPFCSSIALGLPHLKMGQNKILYSLCGVVHHSGTLSGGHYTAYIRKSGTGIPNLSFLNDKALSQADVDSLLEEFMKKKDFDEKNNRGGESAAAATADNAEMNYIEEPEIHGGKWYHVSDTHVSQVTESAVLRCQAYLLFYERIV